MAWFVLIVSGFFEAGWAISLKMSQGFTKLWPTVSFAGFAAVSLAGLAWAMRYLPVGPSYAAWTGIGAGVTAAIGMVWLGESISVLKVVSIAFIISGVVGLNIAGAGH